MDEAPWEVQVFAHKHRSRTICPVFAFIQQEKDPGIQAKIVRKLEHVANVGREDAHRPLVDTVDGPVKRLKVDTQIRILFSWEEDYERIVLFLNATRKKNGQIDPKIVTDAHRYREIWLSSRTFVGLEKLTAVLGVER